MGKCLVSALHLSQVTFAQRYSHVLIANRGYTSCNSCFFFTFCHVSGLTGDVPTGEILTGVH